MIVRGVERLLAPFDAASSAAARAFLGSLPWAHDECADGSLLTANGAPAEVTYVAGSRELRLTAEPSHATDAPARKWRALASLAGALDHPRLAQLRAAPRQRFGCWLGARWRDGARPSFKVYQEVPRDRAQQMHGIIPSLVGFDGTSELYGRIVDARPRVLHELLARSGVAVQLPQFLDAFAFFASRARMRLFDDVHLAAGIRDDRVTLYAPVRQLFADERTSRTRVLALARELSAPLDHYEAASRDNDVVHGLAGITLDLHALTLSIGVSP